MHDNYVLRAFLDAPRTILGGIFLFIAAVLFGQVVCGFTTWIYFDGPLDFLEYLLLTFGCGMLSGIGFIFLIVDYNYIYRLMYKDEEAHTFFFVIAANQAGLVLSASLVMGGFFRTLLEFILTLGILFVLYRATKNSKNGY